MSHPDEQYHEWDRSPESPAPLAKVLPGFLKLNSTNYIEGEFVAETDCEDYEAFKALPSAIEVNGKVLGKSGWSSDRHYACYSERVKLGRMVDLKA